MIGIIAAMNEEIMALKELMSDIKEEELYDIKLTSGLLGNHEVILMQSGIGKVMAALTTTVLIQKYPLEFIINIGSAGSLRSDIRVNSVVIPSLIAPHDIDVPSWSKGFDGKLVYKPSDKLLDIAKKIKDDKTYFEPMVSGDSFIYKMESVEKILSEYPEASCCEMEAYSIARVADYFKVPFIIIRGISDVTIEEGSEMSFEDYVVSASKSSAQYTKHFIEVYDSEMV